MSPRYVALLVSDVHWSHRAPSARRTEPCWIESQRRQIEALYRAWKLHREPAIFIAGDLFDRWNEPVGFVNHISGILDELFPNQPIFYTVPGNHDLPNHSLSRIDDSAYKALLNMQRDRFTCLGNQEWFIDGLHVKGYPWGVPLDPMDAEGQSLAVVHKYAYKCDDTRHALVTDSDEYVYRKGVAGASMTHYGDNHIPFTLPGICNPGSFDIRTKDDVANQTAKIGVLDEHNHVELFDLTQFHKGAIEVPKAKPKASTPSAEQVIALLGSTPVGVAGGSLESIRHYITSCNASQPVIDRVNQLLDEVQNEGK